MRVSPHIGWIDRLRLLSVVVTAICAMAFAVRAGAESAIQEVVIPAPSLAGNLVGTPTTQAGAVYLPPSYGDEKGRRYPVIYLLHGIYDDHSVWLRFAGIKPMLDRLIRSGRLAEAIVVMPDGGNRYGGGYYRDSAVTGKWQSFLAEDLVGYVDRRYRTIASPNGRAFVGWSMGGYGAIHLAMERPGIASAIYALSPCCLSPIEDVGLGNDTWKRTAEIRTEQDLAGALARQDYFAVAGIGILAAFAPNLDSSPFHVRLPFRIEQNRVIPDRKEYDRFSDAFAINRIAQTANALRGLRAFGLDYGIDDHFAHIPKNTSDFSNRMTEFSIPHRFEVYRGDHRNRIRERLEEVALPFVGQALQTR